MLILGDSVHAWNSLWDNNYTFTNSAFPIVMSVCQEATLMERDLPLV